MMNKPIIIDGVDVRKCGFFHPEYDEYCHIALAFSENYGECMKCKDNPDCYYKQLQRLKAENKKLLKELQYKYEEMNAKDFLLMGEDLNFWKNLKAENEKLTNKIKIYEALQIEMPYDIVIAQYRKALEEVREIASDALDIIVENDELLCYVGHIYNIINEVLKDENT